MIQWKDRLRASGIHLGASFAAAGLAALLVFGLWYPYPYREISGGRHLFVLLVLVDVVVGPLITLAVFDRRKRWGKLRRDLATVAALQVVALGYGLWTVAVARPVHLVFEVDRFRVVHAIDVPQELLGRQPAQVQALPWSGPTLLAARPFRNASEGVGTVLAAMNGTDIGVRPDFWEPYEVAKPRVRGAAKPVRQLKARFPDRAADMDATLKAAGHNPDAIAYLPVVSRNAFWTAFVDPATAEVVAFFQLDPF